MTGLIVHNFGNQSFREVPIIIIINDFSPLIHAQYIENTFVLRKKIENHDTRIQLRYFRSNNLHFFGPSHQSDVGNCCRALSTGIRLLITNSPVVARDPEWVGLFVCLACSSGLPYRRAALDRFQPRLAVSADGRACVRWQEPLECHAHGRFLFVV